jgi:hypothetical protein
LTNPERHLLLILAVLMEKDVLVEEFEADAHGPLM